MKTSGEFFLWLFMSAIAAVVANTLWTVFFVPKLKEKGLG